MHSYATSHILSRPRACGQNAINASQAVLDLSMQHGGPVPVSCVPLTLLALSECCLRRSQPHCPFQTRERELCQPLAVWVCCCWVQEALCGCMPSLSLRLQPQLRHALGICAYLSVQAASKACWGPCRPCYSCRSMHMSSAVVAWVMQARQRRCRHLGMCTATAHNSLCCTCMYMRGASGLTSRLQLINSCTATTYYYYCWCQHVQGVACGSWGRKAVSVEH